ncbi:MAG: methionine--tRNA ligase [Anaerolineae bacterium]|nr:MAG: methionine--tRNA ligase [Anaerolineae bacterium]
MSEYIHVSVAWPYANGDLHAGHLAGCYIPADIYARYHRLRGHHVLMVSGSDAHGTPISVEADKRGIPAAELFTYYHKRFLETQQKLGISYDLFTHTDTENHHRIAQDIFLLLLERGYLYRETQQQFYSETEKRFLPDRYVEGECPICHFPDARGDQCDNCGNLLNALDLINPRSKTDGSTPVIRETEHYFLDLSKFISPLETYLKDKTYWRDQVRNEPLSKVKELRGRPITRDIDWGIPLPLDGEDWKDKRMYVWFEAVMGYLTASIEWAKNTGQPDAWKQWWYNPNAKIYNFIGKDNILFHTIIWQAELLGISGIYHDDHTPINLPYDVPANQYLNLEGKQFSKSRGWYISVPDLLERYDPDAIRFYLTANAPETSDADWNWDGFVARNNNELLAKWGNLANRVLKFAIKNFDGRVPEPGTLRPLDEEIITKVEAGLDTIGRLYDAVKLRDALQAAIALATEVNIYLEKAPWFGNVIKEDKQAAATTIYTALRCIDMLNRIFAPVLPFTAERIHAYLGYTEPIFGELLIREYQESTRSHEVLVYEDSKAAGAWEVSKLRVGQQLHEPETIIKKLPPETAADERARMGVK